MNGFDLRAIGWVVTCDMCAEIFSVACGARRRLAPAALQTLVNQWRDLQNARIRKRGGAPLLSFEPRSSPLSSEDARAVEAFVAQIVLLWPARYTAPALRHRMFGSFLHTAVGCVISLLFASASSPEAPLLGTAAEVLMALTLWCLLRSLQLWRTYRVVKEITARSSSREEIGRTA